MDDRDFMDMLYQGFTKTTHAEDAFWGYDEADEYEDYIEVPFARGTKHYVLFYMAQDAPDVKVPIGVLANEEDAAWVTALAGCFPDIHRRWLEALDEADRLDREKDDAEAGYAEVSLRLLEIEQELANYKQGQPRRDTEDWHGKGVGS